MPGTAYADEAHKRAAELAARAHLAYQMSEKTLARISERAKPDGSFSIAQLPTWEPQEVRLGESSLIMVADGMEIPGGGLDGAAGWSRGSGISTGVEPGKLMLTS